MSKTLPRTLPLIIAAHIAVLLTGCADRAHERETYPSASVRYGSIKDESPDPAPSRPPHSEKASIKRIASAPAPVKPQPAIVRTAEPEPRAPAPSKSVATPPALTPEKPAVVAQAAPVVPPIAKTETPLPSETGVGLAGATERTTPVQRPPSVERPAMVVRPPLATERPEAAANEQKKAPPAVVKMPESPAKPETSVATPQAPVAPKIIAPAPAQPGQPVAPKVATPASPAPPTPPAAPAAPRAPLPSDPPTAAPKSAPIATDRPSSAARRDAPAAPTPAGPPAAAPAPIEGVAALIERTNLMLRIGNVQGARSILDDAVKAKNPDAIAELGRTYDPNELKTFLVPPNAADAAKAMELYTEAIRLGSTAARGRLERLKASQTGGPAAPAKQK